MYQVRFGDSEPSFPFSKGKWGTPQVLRTDLENLGLDLSLHAGYFGDQ